MITDLSILSSSGLPALTAAATLALFEIAERVVSPEAKEALTAQIKEFTPERALALPRGAIELFSRVFGDRQFSWKCVRRSILFSIVANVMLCALIVLSNPSSLLWKATGDDISIVARAAVVWLLFIPLIDFLNLYKTRSVLFALARRPVSVSLLISILLGDFLIGLMVFHWLFRIDFIFTEDFTMDPWIVGYLIQHPSGLWDTFGINIGLIARHLSFRDFDSGMFYASMLPSIWLWLYVSSMFLTRGLIRIGGTIALVRWVLNIEKAPLRSLGVVAAILVFVFVLVLSLIELAIA
jgi:hypothetical protein